MTAWAVPGDVFILIGRMGVIAKVKWERELEGAETPSRHPE